MQGVTRGSIDPHVHCRDWNEADKATISSVMQLARNQGVVAIFDMPNTRPSITTRELAEIRLRTAEREGCLEGYYIYIGATKDPQQVIEAARVVETNPKVVGIKLYAGKSVGDLAVTELADQRRIFETLAQAGYTGPLVAHCELESLGRPDLWVPERPASWNLARPPEMEVAAVRELIDFAIQTRFLGHLHICHISTPEAVRLVDAVREELSISCAATPHHLTYSTEDMRTKYDVKRKVNPPIRDKEMVLELRELLRAGKIDWIETDHAPHRLAEKTYDPAMPKEAYLSGMASLRAYANFIQWLRSSGITEEQIERLTYSNIKAVFLKVTE